MKSIMLLVIVSISFISCSSQKTITDQRKAQILYQSGTNYLVKGQYTLALRALLEAKTYDSKNAQIHNNLGMAYYFKKENTQAIKHLKQSIKINEKNSDAKNNLASIYLEQKKYSKAKHLYKAILKDLLYDRQQKTFYNLGLLEERQGNLAKAVHYFRQSTKVDENYCPSQFKLGMIAYNKTNYKLALSQLKKSAMGLCYNNPKTHYYQALTYMKLGKYNTAQLKFSDILDRFPKSKYSPLATEQMVKIRESDKEKGTLEAQVLRERYRKIYSPDF